MTINKIKIINLRQQNEQSRIDLPFKEPRILVLQFNHYKAITRKYRLTFFVISLLFILLGIMAIVKSMTLPCNAILGEYCGSIKTFLCTLCFILAGLSLGIGLNLKTEKEACKCLVFKAKRKLHHHYIKKKIENGLQGFLLWGEKSKIHNKICRYYRITIQQINEKKLETLYQLRQITRDQSVPPEEQEMLLNDTLMALQEFLDSSIQEFLSATA